MYAIYQRLLDSNRKRSFSMQSNHNHHTHRRHDEHCFYAADDDATLDLESVYLTETDPSPSPQQQQQQDKEESSSPSSSSYDASLASGILGIARLQRDTDPEEVVVGSSVQAVEQPLEWDDKRVNHPHNKDDDDDDDVHSVTSNHSDATRRRRRRRVWICLTCLLVLLATLTGIAWWLWKKDYSGSGGASSTTTPTMAPTTTTTTTTTDDPRVTALQQQLVQRLDVPTEAWKDKNSPASRALLWLAHKDQVWSELVVLAEQANHQQHQQHGNETRSDFYYTRRLAQRYVLALLYYSTTTTADDNHNNTTTTTWNDDCHFLNATRHECTWKCQHPHNNNNNNNDDYWDGRISPADAFALANKGITRGGVYCYAYDGYEEEIEHLVLVGNNLVGTLPPELHHLIALRTLWLPYNDLSGSIPSTLATHHFLTDVRLSHNRLDGPPVPPWWAHVDNDDNSPIVELREWRVDHNRLKGPFERASAVANHDTTVVWPPRLQVLDVSWNSLTGSIPTGLWQLTDLNVVRFTGNGFDGHLPNSLGDSVETVFFDHNNLTGTLPETWTTAQGLISLNLRHNLLEGFVPDAWFDEWDDLEMLDIAFNSGLQGNLNAFCVSPRVGQTIKASCDVLPCSCCECL